MRRYAAVPPCNACGKDVGAVSGRYNKADAVLFFSFIAFLISLYAHLNFPAALWADALLMVSEAALVGGIADWFAVTALFRKPLGFPYHTALLPRRRDSFIHAIIIMVQKEFFSRRKLFRHIEKIHLVPMLQEYLRREETEEQLIGTILHFIRASFLRKNNKKAIAFLSMRIKNLMMQEEPAFFFSKVEEFIQNNGWDQKALSQFASVLAKEIEKEETRQSIYMALERVEQEKLGDGFLSRLLQLTNTVNLDEGAELIQQHIHTALTEISRDGSDLQSNVLVLLRSCFSEMCRDDEILLLVRELQKRLSDELPIEETVAQLFHNMQRHLQKDLAGKVDPIEEHMPEVYHHLHMILHLEYQHMLLLIEKKYELQKIITKVLYDLLARSALHAQTLVGVVVGNVLSRLTDEELNRLIYDKVEQDFLWIRINGSVIGAGLGLVLFIFIHLVT